MPEEKEILAVFKADIEQYKAQVEQLNKSNEKAAASTDKVTASTDNLSKKSKTTANAIKTLGQGLGGITGLLALTGRLFGVNTDKLQDLIFASQQFGQVAKKIVDAQKLANAATSQGAEAAKTAAGSTIQMTAANAAAIPILGAIAGAIAVTAGVLIRYQDQLFGVSEAQKDKMKADDGALISDEKLRQQYNESIKTIHDLGIEYRLVTGQITEYQATLERLRIRNSESIEQIKKDTKVKTDEIVGFWAQVRLGVARGLGIGGLEQQKIVDELGRALDDRNAIIKKKGEELTKEEEVALAKRFAEIDKETERLLKVERDRLAKIREERKKAADKLAQDAADQRVKDIHAQLDANKRELDEQIKNLEEKKKREQEEAEELLRLNLANEDLTRQVLKEDKDKEDKEEKERNDKRIEAAKQVADAIFKAQQEAFDKRQELLQQEVDLQDQAIETQRRLAEQGLTNTLAFEEKRAAELRRQQQIEAERQKRVKLLETFLNSLAEFSKADPKTAIQRALVQVALAQAATAVFAEEGGIIGEIGDRSNLSRKHRGGGDVLLHAQTGEGILSRKEMDNLGRRNFHLLKDAARFPIRDDVFAMPQVALEAGVAVSNAEVVKEIKNLQRIIKNKKESMYNLDEFGNYVKTQVEEGVKTITRGKLRKPRFK